MKVVGIRHIAIAHDNSGGIQRVFDALKIHCNHQEVVADQKVKVEFYPLESDNFTFELLVPTQTDSTIQKYINKHGSGIHHFCIEVDDIEQAMKILVQNKIKMIYPQPKRGAHDSLVNFVHPQDASGILVEIAQYM